MSDARRKAEHIRHLLETERDTIHENTVHMNRERYDAIERFDSYEAARTEARAIKEDAIANLPDLLDQVRESVEANGGTVYLADDDEDANRYIESVMDEKDAESLVKSKSMTTEELELNDHLEAAGFEVFETDLGEFVIQVAGEAPSHLVGPSLHKSTAEIAELFNGHFDLDEPLETAEELTNFARDYLLDKIVEADVGMTGANFVLAESGSIVIVTNEGNARKCAVTPDTHVAVAGVEKLLPSVEQLTPFTELIARAATGQDFPQYISMFSPPVDSPALNFDSDAPLSEAEGDRNFHLVLVDNGRLDMREDDQLRETLYCIRCGACANTCANFQHVGGHAFGGETYTGGIATGWEAGIYGTETAGEFNDLCTGCSRCVTACPVKIDIPWINTVVRDRVNRGEDTELDWLVDGLTPDEEEGGIDLQKRFFGNFETVAKLGSATAPLSNWVAQAGPVRDLMERTVGIDSRRDLPSFERTTLRKWFDARGGSAVADAEREAVLYADPYTNYVQVERGKAAVRTLEALGVRVHIPDVTESGRAPLSQGMISTADARASEVYGALVEHVDAGRDVVVVEPSDLAMFRSEYEKLLPERSHERLSDASYEVFEYVYGLLENGADPEALADGRGREIAYHSHCQQRTLGLEAYTEAVLNDRNFDVVTSDAECCGMAGSFGYKTEYYELSMDVGADLRDEFAGHHDREKVASGTSCLEQLDAVFDDGTRHPIELIAPDRS
ncbi:MULTISPECIES: LUD domain-containing protein [unclassified Haladaptatus]|uniref:LUD domain-containing protein n=1 Tax=unclassified Haladaptatus TaxID=2622732 RepID=UPI0023E792FA|nr:MULTISPECIES: LUD domain-containing protein [unclassified Haladaptatus]